MGSSGKGVYMKIGFYNHLRKISTELISKKKKKDISKDDVFESALAMAKKLDKEVDTKKVMQMADKAISIAQKQKGDTETAIGIVKSFF